VRVLLQWSDDQKKISGALVMLERVPTVGEHVEDANGRCFRVKMVLHRGGSPTISLYAVQEADLGALIDEAVGVDRGPGAA
jgi:hypothetical protein